MQKHILVVELVHCRLIGRFYLRKRLFLLSQSVDIPLHGKLRFVVYILFKAGGGRRFLKACIGISLQRVSVCAAQRCEVHGRADVYITVIFR